VYSLSPVIGDRARRRAYVRPGSRGYVPGDVPTSQLATWSAKFCWNPSEAGSNVAWLFREYLAALLGWRRGPLAEFMTTRLTAGRVGALVALLVIADATAFIFVRVASGRSSGTPCSGCSFRQARLRGSCSAAAERSRTSLHQPLSYGGRVSSDTTRLLHESLTDPLPSLYRGPADFLEGRGVKYARAPYWTAYHIAFLTDERVVASSYERVRINEYQDIVCRHRDQAVFLYFDDFCKPTEDGVNVLRWCWETSAMCGVGLAAGGDPKVDRPGESGRLFCRLADGSKVRSTVQPGGWVPPQRKLLRHQAAAPARAQCRRHGRRLIHAHERAVARSKEKVRLDQRAEERDARCGVESPQAARLRLGQSQSRHFEELSLHAPEHIVGRSCRLGRHDGYLPGFDLPGMVVEGATHVPRSFRDRTREFRPELGRPRESRPAQAGQMASSVTSGVRNPISREGCTRICISTGHD
jgi:hypothetical protein